jgi:STE24 endopeptidase
MSSSRLSMFFALVGVLLTLVPPLATARVEKSTSNSAVLDAAAQSSIEPTDAAQSQESDFYELSPAEYARAVAYSRGGYWIYFVTTVYALLILWGMIRWRVASRLRNWAERNSSRASLQFLLYAPALLLIFTALLLPTDIWAQWHERMYGQSVQSWTSWFEGWTMAETTTLILGTLGIALLYFTMRRSPNRWWLWLWAITVPLIVVVIFIQPVVLDPLFNNFEPLDRTHPELVDSIEKIVSRAGLVLPREHIYLLKVSDKSTGEDAFSDGFGPTKRVYISDTLISAEPRPATLALVAHEIGHHMMVLDWVEFAVAVVLSLGLLFVVNRIFVRAIARWGKAWDIRSPADCASLPVLALMATLILVALTPAVNGLSRYREHEADRCALELIHGLIPNAGEITARALWKDSQTDLSDPNPPDFVRLWSFDHPPVSERVAFFRSYDPWAHGQQPRYVK